MLDSKTKKDIEYCTFCPKMCRLACPVAIADAKETFIPTEKVRLLRLILKGRREWDDEAASVFFKCTNCMLCRTFCNHEIEVPRIMEMARGLSYDKEMNPDEMKGLQATFKASANPFGSNLLKKLRAKISDDYFVEGAQVLYFPGCSAVEDEPKIVEDTFELFDRIGVDYVALKESEEMCCGLPLLHLGDVEGFKRHAQKQFDILSGYKMIISPCPACVYTLRVRYMDFGFELRKEVLHISEFLTSLISEGKLKFIQSKKTEDIFHKSSGRTGEPANRRNSQLPTPNSELRTPNSQLRTPNSELPTPNSKVAYHDPCYLGRYLGIYDEPRQILKQALDGEVVEFMWNSEEGMCCGAGGGLDISSQGTAREIASRRVRELSQKEVSSIVSACPRCINMFKKTGCDIEVLDLVSVVARAV